MTRTPGVKPCPECGEPAECDVVDIGVGVQERGNWQCDACGWGELPPEDLGLLEMADD